MYATSHAIEKYAVAAAPSIARTTSGSRLVVAVQSSEARKSAVRKRPRSRAWSASTCARGSARCRGTSLRNTSTFTGMTSRISGNVHDAKIPWSGSVVARATSATIFTTP